MNSQKNTIIEVAVLHSQENNKTSWKVHMVKRILTTQCINEIKKSFNHPYM